MNLIDLIMYISYNFASRTLNRQKDDAKWTAFLISSLYFTMILISLICLLGIVWDNKLSVFFRDGGTTYWFIIGIASSGFLACRYYLYKNKLDTILHKFSSNPMKNLLINKLKYIIMASIPIFLFCVFRLYVVGEIKWW